MSGITIVSPLASSTRLPKKHKFTVQQETYIAKQIMDPDTYAACSGPGTKYIGQQLNPIFYRKFAELFNQKFDATTNSKSHQSKIYKMKIKWESTHGIMSSIMSRGIRLSLSEMQEQLKKYCHYYFILEPALATTIGATETRPVGTLERPIIATISDADDGDDYDCDYDVNSEEDVHVGQAVSSTGSARTLSTPAKKDRALISRAQLNERGLLGMDKDIMDTSRLQCEAEKEHVRQEQMQLQASHTSPIRTPVWMSSATTVSPPGSTRVQDKHALKELNEGHQGALPLISTRKRGRPQLFTRTQHAYIVEHLIDPEKLVALGGPVPKYDGQKLGWSYHKNLTRKFNETFNTTFEATQVRDKIYRTRREWISGKRYRHDLTLEPALSNTGFNMAGSEATQNHSAIATISDPDDDVDKIEVDDCDDDVDEGDDCNGNDHDYDEGIQVISGSGTCEASVLAVPVEKTRSRSTEKGKSNATAHETRSSDMDVLDMLKDLRHTSILQSEAEKKQTRREQLRIKERSRAQQEVTQLEQSRVEEAILQAEESRVREEGSTKREHIRFEEAKMREEQLTKREKLQIEKAKLRIEETKLRKEESTKREAMRIEIEKMKEQVRMKELEIAHTNRLLLLEETRYKRALAEKENSML
ncbi:MAG: hypothetical protein J3Q66DRAFT_59642 [Benniella sp.]|nr:MAG: hypothetical protein J3Q66DRAFT_59642 [Benniella sp.]